MNIFIFNWKDIKNPKAGGAEIVTHEHAKAWVKSGHNVYWFTTRYPSGLSCEVIDGVQIRRFGNSTTVYLYAPFYYLFTRTKPDVVIDQIHGIPFFTPLYVHRPIIAFIHEVAGELWNYKGIYPIRAIGKKIESWSFALYKNRPFWTDAPSTIAELSLNGIDKTLCVAIPCPAQNNTLNYLPKKEKSLTCIYVNRLEKFKGIEDVINAFSYIIKKEPSAVLWIVGAGNTKYTNKLKLLTTSLKLQDNVIFFGKVPEKEKLHLMRSAHVLLHASVKEGWGLVVIEAASQATPSVVYNVAGLRDSVKHGRTGIILEKNVPESMAREVLKLVNDKQMYKAYQNNCLVWAKSLTWKKVTNQSLKLLETVANNH